jgi:aminoglycoside phosphotransferase (APT) family kinase protein
MEQRIAAYLAHRMPEASDIVVDELHRIHGGSSQETFRLRARWTDDGLPIERELILRRAPSAGLVVAERDLEYSVYRALARSGVPVPAVHFMELDPAWLERPFFVMDLCPGKPGHPYAPGDPYEGHGDAVAREFWRHLGTLAAIDHRSVGFEHLRNRQADDRFWSLELDHWEAVIAPSQSAARRRQTRHRPWRLPLGQFSVHRRGCDQRDPRLGNVPRG